jgi:hypothetical protein
MPGEYEPIRAWRRICAPADVIFQFLADPRMHLNLDGSGMLRGVASGSTITGVGDIFVMNMFYEELGDYQMINHVVEYEPGRRIGWEPEAGPEDQRSDIDDGRIWIQSMNRTLSRLDQLCASQPGEERTSR